MLTCTKCKETKANSLFAPDAKMKTGKSSWCKQCKKEYQKRYVAKQKRLGSKEWKEKARESSRQSGFIKYGITEEDYFKILELQNGVCAGCGKHPVEKRRLDIDHKHQPQEKKREPWERAQFVRGLLCTMCNRILGIARDNANVLRNLAEYLDSPPALPVIIPKYQAITAYLDNYEKHKNAGVCVWEDIPAAPQEIKE